MLVKILSGKSTADKFIAITMRHQGLFRLIRILFDATMSVLSGSFKVTKGVKNHERSLCDQKL